MARRSNAKNLKRQMSNAPNLDKQEAMIIREKILEKVANDPRKAAKLLTLWINDKSKNSNKKKNSAA